MTINISYMGTKRQLAPHVAEIIADDRDGPLLDIFSGVSAIGSFIAPARPIWCNDAQLFAFTVAEAFFVATGMPPSATAALNLLRPLYTKNKNTLEERFRSVLNRENKAIEAGYLAADVEAQKIPNIQTSRKLSS